ncbi:hypothetical protein [Streptomyces spongiae]|uniref:hypothetical protein n=1 Tax=Streptomyces spongiae TaxID=565072 RepID=UPI001D15796B
MEGLDLKGYDLAFPSSQAPAAELAKKYGVKQTCRAPSTPRSSSWPTATPLWGDFERLRGYLADVELPPAASGRLTELTDLFTALLDAGWVAEVLAGDPEGVHALSRAVRQDVPEAVDTFVRTRWWTRLSPGADPPERHLERQLSVLQEEFTTLAAPLRDVEARRQESHTRYLEDRSR